MSEEFDCIHISRLSLMCEHCEHSVGIFLYEGTDRASLSACYRFCQDSHSRPISQPLVNCHCIMVSSGSIKRLQQRTISNSYHFLFVAITN